MNIAVVGLGGVGGYYGAKLAKLSEKEEELNLYFIARGAHLEAIKRNGITLKQSDGEKINSSKAILTDDLTTLPELDVCIITVKGQDLHNVLENLHDKLHSKTEIIALLNGADIYERVRSVIKTGIVYPACVYINATIESPGIIGQYGNVHKIVFGNDPENLNEVPTVLFSIFEKANIEYSWTLRIFEEIWKKFLYIASYALVTASTSKTVGEVYSDEEASNLVIGIMEEIVAIAKKKNILMEEEAVQKAYHLANNFAYDSTTSFQRDYQNPGKGNEKETLGKVIIDLGEELDIPTPVTKRVYNSLR